MNQAISATAVFPLGELRQATFVQRVTAFGLRFCWMDSR